MKWHRLYPIEHLGNFSLDTLEMADILWQGVSRP